MLKMGFAEDVETILADTPPASRSRSSRRPCRPRSAGLAGTYRRTPSRSTSRRKTTTASNITQRTSSSPYPQKVDALTRILEVEPFEGMIVFTRTKNETETARREAPRPRLHRRRDQRRRRAGAARADRRPAEGRQARRAGGHRRRRPRTRRRPHQPRRQLRPARSTPSRTSTASAAPAAPVARATRSASSHRVSGACSPPSRRRRVNRSRRWRCRAPTTSTRPASRGSTTPSRRRCRRPSGSTRSRDIIAHYVRHHDVPEADVAAALAVVARVRRRCCSDAATVPHRRRAESASTATATATGRDRFGPRGRARTAATGAAPRVVRPDHDLPHRGRPTAQGRAAPDRRRARERGRARAAKTSARSRSVPTSRSSSFPPTCPPGPERLASTRISGRLIEIKPDRFQRSAKRTDRPSRPRD